MSSRQILLVGLLDLNRARRAAVETIAIGGDAAWLGAMIIECLAQLPDVRRQRRDDALVELVGFCRPGTDRSLARQVAAKLARYEATRWPRERKLTAAPLIYGAEGHALFEVMQNTGASGAPKERTIRAALARSRALGKIPPIAVAHFVRDPAPMFKPKQGQILSAISKIPESEILASLARDPGNRKIVEVERAKTVAERQKIVGRIAALNSKAEASWPRLTAAIDAAESKVKATQAALREANARSGEAVNARSSASWTHTNLLRECELELIAGADMETIDAFKSELHDMREATFKRGVIVIVETVERNAVTGAMRRIRASNIVSIHARQAAIAVALRTSRSVGP
jgi:hypothetical protein